MRDSNFRSVPQNRASVSITGNLYDRRALDCTSDKPLINSLNHLTYLTSTSNKVRDTLCIDGGLERLISILRSCVLSRSDEDDAGDAATAASSSSDSDDAASVSSKSSRVSSASATSSVASANDSASNSSSICAYKWMLSLQCLLFLGTRGTEKVRRRIVEAGMLPVIGTVLDNFLLTVKRNCPRKLEAPKSHRHRHHHHHHHHHHHNHHHHEHREQLQQPQQALEMTPQQSAVQPPQPPQQFALTDQTLSQNRAYVQHLISQQHYYTSDDTQSLASARSSQPTESVLSSNASVVSSIFSMSSVSTVASSVDNVPMSVPVSLAQSILNAAAGPSNPNNNLHSQASGAVYQTLGRPNRQLMPPAMPASPSQTLFDNPATRQTSAESIITVPNAAVEANNDSTTGNGNGGDASSPLQVVADDDDVSTADGPVVTNPPPARAPATQQRAGGVAAGTANMGVMGAIANAIGNANGAPGATVGAGAAAVTDSSLQSGRVPHIRRVFRDGVIVPQNEDILWALEILAFVTKYAYLKPSLQSSHLVPSLSIRDKDQPPLLRRDLAAKREAQRESYMDVEMNDDEPTLNYEEYDFDNEERDRDPEYNGEEVNLFKLVEHFTVGDFAKDIKYWAGVIMRNSCRKDDARGGIRQCANFACGKWEEFPRQFAKCKRCKRTKYCSKECQMSTWSSHKHWCVPTTSGSATSASSSQR